MKIIYLSVEHVMALHDIGIEQFGGTMGLRDKGLLESAVSQPQQSFGGEDLFPTVLEKAAAYAYYISENQPFLDGNKRTAMSTAAVFLDLNGHELTAPQGAVYDVIMAVANKRMSRDEFANWFQKNSRKKRRRSAG